MLKLAESMGSDFVWPSVTVHEGPLVIKGQAYFFFRDHIRGSFSFKPTYQP